MVNIWATDEMASVEFGDTRLDQRLTQILSALGERPTASIPAACGGYAEMAAAYRFFDNQKVTYDKILDPHTHKTHDRVREQTVVLCVQDTSEIDLTRPHQPVEGAGPLASDARRGVLLHRLDAFTTDGTPLGRVWSQVHARDDESLQTPQPEKRKRRKAAPIEDKESFRWLEGLRKTRELAEQCPGVTCVCVADSEADIYELFAEERGPTNPIHFLVRLCQDRALAVDPPGVEDQASSIRSRVQSGAVLFTKEISVRGREAKFACEHRGRRQPRQDRRAMVEVRAATMTLRPPYRREKRLPEVNVNVIQVREINTPANDVAVEWLLVTTLPIETADHVREAIAYYCVRWMIEVFFRTLKSGCRVENRRFEHVDRLTCCLAVYEVIAWRTVYVCRLGRNCPEMSCEAVFEPSEWKSVWMAVHQKSPPRKPPRLSEMVRLIAQLGGYVNRPERTDPPGPQTVWLGIQRMHDLAWAWETFGPEARQ
jgi:hypothetical protein